MLLNVSCEKYLNEKSDDKLAIPSSIGDLQALLDDEQFITQRNPKVAEISSDDYYLKDADWATLNENDRRTYIWDKPGFPKGYNNDWGFAYTNVQTANTVLSFTDKINRMAGDQADWNSMKGQALFLRAQAFFHVACIWAAAYDETTAQTDLGIPLRLDPDFNRKTTRASLIQTYDQIISDLQIAADLLPAVPKNMLRPSKPGAYALLARVYLSMRNYKMMGVYADLCLRLKGTLKDYNTINASPAVSYPFAPKFSNDAEIITESSTVSNAVLNIAMARIDSTLYNSFNEQDLRKRVLFKSNNDNTVAFRGSYSGAALFSGLATNEVYLMRAEYFAREGNVVAAMADLNSLLQNRFTNFTPLHAANKEQALSLILAERRKELMMRGLRWMDIKRLNKEGANIILKRVVNGRLYVLPPNDLKYALPIPDEVISISGIVQNPG